MVMVMMLMMMNLNPFVPVRQMSAEMRMENG